ncbi:low molecular weight phosphatase family protein [Halorubrum sp. Ib24]|nr:MULTISPECIES: low molecular weight phosphatase family protein [unclassified Halorubrum]OYR38993.1 low molecular weight phosphatase family protein [Halorubrum sp. Ib24]OYR45831.1 low molecular weight phosphatase family protein [Halorubrum sp. Eb13]OYR51038.1 low molecular weight phosphatase family protein [Halorubrum sp. Ea1]
MIANNNIRLDFVCVHNAGRSQMAAAFAERERSKRGLEELVEIHSGGTEPADAVHEEVVEAMAEVGIDIAGRTPKWVAELEQLENSDYLVTMGCSIMQFDPAQYGVESHEWDLVNPDGQDMDTVRDVRDEIEARVETLFDEIERLVEEEQTNTDSSSGLITSIRDSLSF